MSKNIDKGDAGRNLTRRELLKKYGAYTTPTVVALALPDSAYAHMSTQKYSTLIECYYDDGHANPSGKLHCYEFHMAPIA